MRITKFQHATMTVEKNDELLLIDPGSFTADLPDLTGLVGVVVTHEHADHWTPAHLTRVREEVPGVPIYGPAGVVAATGDIDITEVSPGDTVTAGSFTLRLFGGRHSVIHESIPVVDNVGVLVDERFYYPGDSYAVPENVAVEMLAAPIGAPWLKIGEAMDFVLAVAPRQAFGTHEATLSAPGLQMHHQRLQWATEQNGGSYHALQPGESITIG